MKRLLAILMAVAMLFSFAACNTSEDTDVVGGGKREFTTGYDETKYNAPGTLPVFKEKTTISLTMKDSSYVEDWETNKQTHIMEEQLNADLVLNVLPSGEFSTKINLMAAAGGEEFSDVIIGGGFSDGMVMNLADAGVIVPITEYAYNKDIGYNMYEAIERLGYDYYQYMTMPDGEIYYLPSIGQSILRNNSKMFVYEPWFTAAGIELDSIHTTEDFKEALLKVAKSDPNGNGKADEVGIESYSSSLKWIDYLMCPFIYSNSGGDYMYVRDGKIGFAFQRDEWKDGLKYIKEIYDLGLVDPLSFSQDSAAFKSIINAEDTLITAWAMTDATRIAEGNPRRVEYQAIPPLNSAWEDGRPLSVQSYSGAGCGMVISHNAADPEAAFRFGDYMCSEEMSVYIRYGEKGVDWFEPKEGDVSMYDALGYEPYLIEALPWGEVQNSHWYGTGPYIRHEAITAGAVWNGIPNFNKTGADGQVIYHETGPSEHIVKLIYTEEENEIISSYLANIKSYAQEMTVKFIRGESDIDNDWDEFQNQLEMMNANEVLECAQAAFERIENATK